MINSSRYVEIEEQLTGMYMQTARADFVRSLQDQIYERAAQQALHPRKSMMLRPGWVVTALVLLAFVIGFLPSGRPKSMPPSSACWVMCPAWALWIPAPRFGC